MAFYSYPFESQNTGTAEQPVYDRAITAENERQFNKLRYTNGVFIESSLDDDLQVIPGNGMAVKVSKGGCHIEGALAYNDNAITLSLEAANATLRRIDRIVARFNTSTSVRSIMVYVKTGTNATNPVAPALQRESNFWELGLADITIPAEATSISASNILDTRMDDSLCGRVLPAIPYVTQLGSLYQQYQELIDSALSGTVAGQLEARIAAEEEKIQPVNKGGTGATTAAVARANLGVKKCGEYDILPIERGGTGATTAEGAREELGLSHVGAAASARGTGSVSLSATVITKVPLGAWIARTDTAFAFSDGGIKCPYDGVVEISGSVYINTTSGGTHGCYIVCGDYDTSQFLDTGSGGAISSGRIIIPVSAGDIVYLKGRSSQTSSVAANLSSTHLDVKYIK